MTAGTSNDDSRQAQNFHLSTDSTSSFNAGSCFTSEISRFGLIVYTPSLSTIVDLFFEFFFFMSSCSASLSKMQSDFPIRP